MSGYNKSMFESIKKTLQENTGKKGNSNFKDFLKTTAGNSYLVRFLPNVDSPEDTFFHYFHYGWNSVSTGQYIEAISPKTWGDPDPIEGERIKLYRNKSDKNAIELAKNISTKEKWLVNVYVVDDPVNPENNGTIKILRYGPQLGKIIQSAIDGEDAEEYGAAIFDLSENGCNFRIKVESTKEGSRSFVNYSASRFLRPSAIPNMTPAKSKEVLGSLHDLTTFFTRKAPAELKEMLAVHLYGRDDDKSKTREVIEDDTEETPVEDTDAPEAETTEASTKKTTKTAEEDDKIKELLKGL